MATVSLETKSNPAYNTVMELKGRRGGDLSSASVGQQGTLYEEVEETKTPSPLHDSSSATLRSAEESHEDTADERVVPGFKCFHVNKIYLSTITILVLCMALLLVCSFSCFVVTLVELSQLKSEIMKQAVRLDNLVENTNLSEIKTRLARQDKLLTHLISTYDNLSFSFVSEVGQQLCFPAVSYASPLSFYPNASSDYYWVWSSNGSAVRVYCDMTRSCGGVTGG